MTGDGAGPAASGRRRHHIAAVAHHFLGGSGDGAGARELPAVVVAAAEPVPVSAFVAAGAARTGAIADGGRWQLLEDGGCTWSARSHLDNDERVRLVTAAGFPARGEPGGGLCWHLGAANAERLDAWSNARCLPGCALPTAGRPVHLFWCLPAETAAALSPLSALARLAVLVEPERVDLIVAPRNWPQRERRETPAATLDDRLLARLRARAADLSTRPVRLGVVGPGMGTSAAAALITEFLHASAAAAGS